MCIIYSNIFLVIVSFYCQGMNHFYSDQPELSLRFYRRLLQMGIGELYCHIVTQFWKSSLRFSFLQVFSILGSAELYNNLGLCCFFAQQYDMTLTCFQVHNLKQNWLFFHWPFPFSVLNINNYLLPTRTAGPRNFASNIASSCYALLYVQTLKMGRARWKFQLEIHSL